MSAVLVYCKWTLNQDDDDDDDDDRNPVSASVVTTRTTCQISMSSLRCRHITVYQLQPWLHTNTAVTRQYIVDIDLAPVQGR